MLRKILLVFCGFITAIGTLFHILATSPDDVTKQSMKWFEFVNSVLRDYWAAKLLLMMVVGISVWKMANNYISKRRDNWIKNHPLRTYMPYHPVIIDGLLAKMFDDKNQVSKLSK